MYIYIAQLAYDAEQAAFDVGQTPDPAIHLSWVWLTGAVGVNNNDGAFSTIIREYNKRQGQLRGTPFTDSKLQEASNKVGAYMYAQIEKQFRDTGAAYLPTVKEIGEEDLKGVRDVLYGGASGNLILNQAWPGILMLGKLGEDFTGRLLQHDETSPVVFDTLEDAMNVLYAWESFRYAFENTSISNIGWRDVRVALNINELADYLNGTSAYAWFKELVGTQNNAALNVLDMVAKVGSPHFLDMLMSARLGRPVYGSTTETNFAATANAFLGEISPQNLQSYRAELMPTTAAAMVAKAKTDINARAALAGLSSVSVEIVASVAQDLDLYDPATGTGELTDLYLKDRAAMLSWKMKYDSGARDDDKAADDFFRVGNKPYSADWDIAAITGNWDFIDHSIHIGGSPLQLAIDGKDITFSDHQIAFGSTGADSLDGSGDTDHLYGMSGADTLTGNKGSDYLEGGAGFDTYVVNAGDGYDTLLDTDGLGVIKIGGIEARGSAGVDPAKWLQLGDDTWVDKQNGIVYGKRVVDGETRLIIKKGDSSVLVRGWSAGGLGIELGAGTVTPLETPAAPATSLTITGDLEPLSGDQGGYDALDNRKVSGILEPDREDTLYDSVGNDHLLGVGGDDILYAWRGGDDLLEGGAGKDYLYGGSGDDTLLGGADNDYLRGEADDDTLKGGAGKDRLFGEAGKDFLEGGAGSDVLLGGAGVDALFATDKVTDLAAYILAAETQQGGGRGDWLSGDEGADTLVGDTGNDVLAGGEGEDLLIGGGGNDDIRGDASGSAGIEWTLTRSVQTSGESTQYVSDTTDGGLSEAAAGGTDVIYGGAGDDWLFGNQGNDIIDAGADNDVVFGGEGADVILGQGGNDTLFGSAGGDNPHSDGADYIDGGDGNDSLVGSGGNDTLIGGEGNDALNGDSDTLAIYEGDDYLDGGIGDDVLWGGGKNDTLLGGAGSDKLCGGAGDDTLDGGADDDYLAGGTDNDTYLNVTSADTIFDIEGNNTIQLVAVTGLGADNLTATALTGGGGITYIQFGVALDDGSVLKLDSPFFTNGSNTLQFANGATLDVEALVAKQLLTPLSLQLRDTGGRVYGGAGDDFLLGGAGNDTLLGYGGNDILQGGAGDDTYLGVTSGDTIFDIAGNNKIVLKASGLGEGGLATSLQINNEGAQFTQLHISLNDGGVLKLDSPFFASGSNTLQFANGAVLDVETLVGEQLLTPLRLQLGDTGGRVYGGAGDDFLYGGAGNDTLLGYKGQDTLLGGDGNDVLDGGAGNDVLNGGAGADTIVFGRNSGHDTLAWQPDEALSDRVTFAADIALADLIFSRTITRDLVIAINGESASLTLKNWFGSSQHPTQFVLANGATINLADIVALGAPSIAGTEDNDVRVGTEFADHILGGGGDDTIDGGGANDVLEGGAGRDVYKLRPGRIDAGNGMDTVLEQAVETSLIKLEGALLKELTARQDGNDLVLSILGTGEGLLLKDYYVQAHTWKIADSTGVEESLAAVLMDNDTRRAGMDNLAKLEEEFTSRWRAQLSGELLVDAAQREDGRIERKPDVRLGYNKTLVLPVAGSATSRESGWVASSGWNFTTLGEQTLLLNALDASGWGYGGNVSPGFQAQWSSSMQNIAVGGWEINKTAFTSADYMLVANPYKAPTHSAGGTPLGSWYSWNQYASVLVSETQHISAYGQARAISVAPASGSVTDGVLVGQLTNVGGALPNTVTVNVGRTDQTVMLSRVNGTSDADEIHATGQVGEAYVIHGGGGDDFIRLELGLDASVPVEGLWEKSFSGGFLDGGAGDDLVVGSRWDDILIGGSGADHLRGGDGSDRYIISGGGTDLLSIKNPTDSWIASSRDVIELPEGVTAETLTSAYGQAIVGGKVVSTLDLSWGGATLAKIVLPRVGIDYQAAAYDPVSVRFTNGVTVALDDLIAGTPVPETIGYYAGQVRVALLPNAGSLSGVGADNVLVVHGAGVSDVTTGAGRNLLQAFNPDSAINLTLAADSETWLGYGYYMSEDSTKADLTINGSTHAQLHIQASSINELGDIQLGRVGNDLVLSQHNPSGDTTAWNRELRFNGWFSEAAPHQVEFEARVYDENLGQYRNSHLNLQAWVDQFAAQTGGVIPDGGSVMIGSLGWQAAEVPFTWEHYRPAGLGRALYYSTGDFSAMTWQAPLAVVDFTPGMGGVTATTYGAIRFDTAIASLDVRFQKSGNDLVVMLATGVDVLRLSDWYLRTDSPEAWFADGEMWDYGLMAELGATLNGTETNDTLTAPDDYGWQLNGRGGSDVLVGNGGDNVLLGGEGNDILIGGAGADRLEGGEGSDGYQVDDANDEVSESADEGTWDWIESTVSYTLSDNVEGLQLAYGAGAIDGTGTAAADYLAGNESANVLTGLAGDDTLEGNGGDDILEGGAGIDTLYGGSGSDILIGGVGDDIYVIDDTQDTLIENAGEGIDQVQSSVTTTLSANVENLTLTGAAVLDGTGNALDNILTGNSGNNALTGGAGNDILIGGAGADTLAGGIGNDGYHVDNASDIVVENADEGTWDWVESTVSHTLSDNVEGLQLAYGAGAIDGTGTAAADYLAGNESANVLTGLAGDDTLEGMAGNDTYILARGYAADTVVENDATAGNTDIAQFLTGIAADQIWFQKVGNNLEASIIGTGDKLVVQNWYLGNAYHVEQFKTTDGAKTLIDSNVQNLVNAMASFAPPAAGQTSLPTSYQTTLAPVIAANWQ